MQKVIMKLCAALDLEVMKLYALDLEVDKILKIDFQKIKTITRLVFLTAWELANREDRIVVDKK